MAAEPGERLSRNQKARLSFRHRCRPLYFDRLGAPASGNCFMSPSFDFLMKERVHIVVPYFLRRF